MVAPLLLLPIFILQLSATSAGAHAASASDENYYQALRIAQRKVERQNAASSTSLGAAAAISALTGISGERSALVSSGILAQIAGREYRVGDSWEVVAVRTENPIARMTSDPAHLKTAYGRAAIFRYTVREVDTGPGGRLVVQVEQIAKPEAPKPDPRVRAIVLTLATDSTQTRKEYQIGSSSIPVSPEGIRSRLSELEFFPLDLPEIRTAEALPGRGAPELPERLRALAGGRIPPTDSSNSLWFEQDDFFGRPVQALWRKGDPWPTYLKTANGIAVLLSGGQSQ